MQAILPDKLSAFAPNTIGVPYIKNGFSSSLEVIKQLNDVAFIFQKLGNILSFEAIKESYQKFSTQELRYREFQDLTYKECLNDTFNASLAICSRGVLGDTNNYACLVSGINGFKNLTFEGQYTIENAQEDATLVAWLSTCLMLEDFNKVVYPSFDKIEIIAGTSLINKLNKQFKKSNPKLLSYWNAIDKMLN